MIGWIILGYLGAALLTFRFWSMPKWRAKYLKARKRWDECIDSGRYAGEKPLFPAFVAIAIGVALAWPGPALYRLLWPKGIDYKFEKEKIKAQAKKAAEDALKEAERIAKEYGLRNPKD